MNYKKIGKSIYPQLTPDRPGGFVAAYRYVVIAGWDQPVALVFTGKDIRTLISVAQSALRQKPKKGVK